MASNSENALGLLNLILPRTTTSTQTQRTSTSKAGVKAATDQILQQLIPRAVSNQQAAGGFGSSSYALAAADAAAKAGAYSEELNKETSTTTTNKQAAAIDPRIALALFAGNKLLDTETGKKAKDWFSGLFSSDSGESPTSSAFSNLSFGGGTSTGGLDGGSFGSMLPGLFENFNFEFADGGRVKMTKKNCADGGSIEGDPALALQQMLSYISGGLTPANIDSSNVPGGSSNPGAFEQTFKGYGKGVDRDFSKELSNFLQIGQSVLTANPIGLATGITRQAKMDAQNRMLQGFAEGNPDAIQSASAQISMIQSLQDTAGTAGKVKSAYDTVTGFGGLTDAFQAVDSNSAKALVSAVGAEQAYGLGKDLKSVADSITGSSEESTESGNFTWGRLGKTDAAGLGGWAAADGGYLGGMFQKDTKGVDRIKTNKNVNLSGGEFIIPTDVVSKLSPQFFEDLVNRFHTQVRG